ncbi:hypothetical protein [Methylococcus sp. EFPC2]|uniref:hypothetical protein n=1 Tax=Methylococcus sp. EFPC2 TaxID=2812648 RepID=UPI001967DD6B|nr:hypothetical protein [Methylococcus sp. EFPC2]QSA96548.1 hypothetical protein JWZ97_15190 [Methylococcus sp. EFPC2]
MFKPAFRTIFTAGLLGAVTLGAGPAWATAIAHSNLTFHDVGIAPKTGTVQFTGPWILQAQASANNSLGEFSPSFSEPPIDEKIGPDTATFTAAVTWASAGGVAIDPPPTPPYLEISGSATADGNIPGKVEGSAISQGQGTVRLDDPFLPSYFQITGGPDGDPVSVTFNVLIDYALSVKTDQYGVLAEAEVTFSQQLFGDDVGFVTINALVPDQDLRTHLVIGPNSRDKAGKMNYLLTNTLDLHYGVRYALLNGGDAEERVANIPEPATLWLMALFLPAMYRTRRA